jgi:pimeloyl-ACP methyl ester carboxylesterase
VQLERRLVPLADGRTIDVLSAGPDDGFPVVMHTGTPSGLVAESALVAASRERGLRYIQPARPGYEGSTPRPGRRVGDVASDVAQVLDALGATEFVSIGHSGGGAHSLACAALLPGRCLAAASVAGLPPYGADGLDWVAGMGPENVTGWDMVTQGGDAYISYLEKEAEQFREVTGEQVAAAMGGLVSAADARILTDEFAAEVAESFRGAVREGIAGWRDDELSFIADWGFTLDALAGRVAIWQGGQDNMVPFSHGQWLAAHIPDARVHLEPCEGHLTLIASMDRILDDLLDLAGRR